MYCPYCGKTLVENASFCMSCGKPVLLAHSEPSAVQVTNTQLQQYQTQKDVARKCEIDTLTNAIYHFSQKAPQFKEYDYVCNRLNYYAGGASSALLVWGCIILSLSLLALIVFLTEGYTEDDLAILFLLFLLPGIGMLVGGILLKVGNRRKFAYFKERYAQLSAELYNHYAAFPQCPVEAEYVNPAILQRFLRVLQSGRADTIRESVSLTVSSRHQARLYEYFSALKYNTADVQSPVPVFFAADAFFLQV